MKIICLIIARGGSKGLPRKNILKINDIPLIGYPIFQARNIKLINRVIVSSDNDRIIRVSKKYGAEILFKRPRIISGDKTTDLEVFTHALNFLKKKENFMPDLIVDLRATEPIRDTKNIIKAINLMMKNMDYDSLRSISKSTMRPEHMWQINKYPKKIILSKLIETIGFQNSYLKNYYWQNGYIDIIKPSTILKKKSMSGNKIIPFIIKKKNFTIDYRDDLEQIEILLKKQSEKIKISLFGHHR